MATKNVLLLVVLLALWGPALPAQQRGKALYPLRPGSKWTYLTGDKKEVVLQVTRVQNVSGIACHVLETKREDGLLLSEYVADQLDGLYRMQIGIDKVLFRVEPALCFVKSPAKGAVEWQVNSTLGGAGGETVVGSASQDFEEVRVPLGTFKAVRVRVKLKRNDDTITFTSYFAPGVGMVKHVESWKGQEKVLELQKYQEGK